MLERCSKDVFRFDRKRRIALDAGRAHERVSQLDGCCPVARIGRNFLSVRRNRRIQLPA
jgi:hypothetical protein